MEICVNDSFLMLSEENLLEVNGGTLWGVISGTFVTVGGTAQIVGGVLLLGVPEPTGTTKFAGTAAIMAGVATVTGGVISIADNLK